MDVDEAIKRSISYHKRCSLHSERKLGMEGTDDRKEMAKNS